MKLLFILLCFALMFGCGSKNNSDMLIEKHETSAPEINKNETNLLDEKEMAWDKIQDFYYPNSGELQFQGNYDKKGRQQGLWKEYWKNGHLRAEGYVLDGKIIGLWKYYYETGQIERATDISDGNNGYVKRYFKNGKLSFEGGMKDGVDDGLCKSYYENGQLKAIGNIKNSEGMGVWKIYNQDGQLIEEKYY